MITIESYEQYRHYFSEIGYAFPEIALAADGSSYVMSDSARVLTKERSVTRYPMLELTRPSLTGTAQDRSGRFVYDCELAVLAYVKDDDFETQDKTLDLIMPVIEKIVAKMIEDEILADNTVEVIPIKNTSNDQLWGWGLSFQLQSVRPLCYTEDGNYQVLRLSPVWQDGDPVSLTLDGETYEAAWTERTFSAVREAIDSIVAQIGSRVDEAMTEGFVDEPRQPISYAPFTGAFNSGFQASVLESGVWAYRDEMTLVLVSDEAIDVSGDFEDVSIGA